MRTKVFNYAILSMLSACLFFTSCTKENNPIFDEVLDQNSSLKTLNPTDEVSSLVIEEELAFTTQDEQMEVQFVMKMNGQTMTTDAFAAHCDANGEVFFAISNKIALLDTLLYADQFEENDFLFMYKEEEGALVNSFGGAAFGEAMTGIPGLQIVFSDVEVIIDSNDGTIISGTMNGAFQGFDPATGDLIDLPFSVTFSAEIVDNGLVLICD